MSRRQIEGRFGASGISEFAVAFGRKGAITDNTQLTLFTADGVLRATVRMSQKGICHHPSVIANAYLRWLRTQGEASKLEWGAEHHGWLIDHAELFSRRTTDKTCLSALRTMKELGQPAKNKSKSCSALTRIAPVALLMWKKNGVQALQETFVQAAEVAALTHGHPTGILSAAVFAVLLLGLIDGVRLDDVIVIAKDILKQHPHHEETLAAIQAAESAVAKDGDHRDALEKLGPGYSADEALAIAVYCALSGSSQFSFSEYPLSEQVALAVNNGGASAATGSLTGQLLGAIRGVAAIPPSWLEGLELNEVITGIAGDLYAFRDWQLSDCGSGGDNDMVWERYPGV
jgi:ADP-ribosylglycohydrolase